jgi:hypothetical protein
MDNVLHHSLFEQTGRHHSKFPGPGLAFSSNRSVCKGHWGYPFMAYQEYPQLYPYFAQACSESLWSFLDNEKAKSLVFIN